MTDAILFNKKVYDGKFASPSYHTEICFNIARFLRLNTHFSFIYSIKRE